MPRFFTKLQSKQHSVLSVGRKFVLRVSPEIFKSTMGNYYILVAKREITLLVHSEKIIIYRHLSFNRY